MGVARRLAGCAAVLTGLAGCQTGSAFRNPADRLNPDMAAVISNYVDLGGRPVNTLTVAQARSQPTLADAARAVQRARSGVTRAPFVTTSELTVPGAAGPLPARLYDGAPGKLHQPIILYFHGGLWVTGDLDRNDDTARALAVQAHALVLSVAYRLAPEARFPAAEDDALAAYRWLLDYAATLGADPRRIAVAGEAAGATMALDTAVAARDGHIPPPVHALLIEPVTGPASHTRSALADRYDVPLNRADVRWSLDLMVGSPADLDDPRLDLLGAADLHGLPATTVISSELDPLESQGSALAQKLQASGVAVSRTEYQGTAHGFFGLDAVVARARQAQALAAQEMDATFQRIGEPPPPPQSARHAKPGRRHAHRRALVHRPA